MSPGAESRVMSTMSTKGGILDHIVGPASMTPLTDDFYRQAIFQHKKRKLEDPVRHENCFICMKHVVIQTTFPIIFRTFELGYLLH